MTNPLEDEIEKIVKEFDFSFDYFPAGKYEGGKTIYQGSRKIFTKLEVKEWLRSALSRYRESVLEESNKDKEELAEVLLSMYTQYCSDGHQFMSAGEGASEVLERLGYLNVDEAGRITHYKESKVI